MCVLMTSIRLTTWVRPRGCGDAQVGLWAVARTGAYGTGRLRVQGSSWLQVHHRHGAQPMAGVNSSLVVPLAVIQRDM